MNGFGNSMVETSLLPENCYVRNRAYPRQRNLDFRRMREVIAFFLVIG
jgi:hypothetical protein